MVEARDVCSGRLSGWPKAADEDVAEWQRVGACWRLDMEHPLVELPPFPRAADLLAVIPKGKSWLWEASRTGRFPKPFKLSDRTTVWRREEVLEWLKEKANATLGES